MDPRRTGVLLRERGLAALGIGDGVPEDVLSVWREVGAIDPVPESVLPERLRPVACLGPWGRIRIEELGFALDESDPVTVARLRLAEDVLPRRLEALRAYARLPRRTLERAGFRVLGRPVGLLLDRMVALAELLARVEAVPVRIRCDAAGHGGREAYLRRVNRVVASDEPWLREALARRGVAVRPE